jgi:hypothetical protein
VDRGDVYLWKRVSDISAVQDSMTERKLLSEQGKLSIQLARLVFEKVHSVLVKNGMGGLSFSETKTNDKTSSIVGVKRFDLNKQGTLKHNQRKMMRFLIDLLQKSSKVTMAPIDEILQRHHQIQERPALEVKMLCSIKFFLLCVFVFYILFVNRNFISL